MAKPLPLYRPGKKAGYDPKSRRWRDLSGHIIPKNSLKAAGAPDDLIDSLGAVILKNSRTPFSDMMDDYEKLANAGKKFNQLIAFEKTKTPHPQPLPADIRAMYNLSDYYTRTQGDVWTHIEAPIEVAITDLEIDCPSDPGIERELQGLYLERMGMRSILTQAWMSVMQYGVFYPLEAYQDEEVQVVPIPPRFMWVGYYIGYGTQVLPEPINSRDVPYSILPVQENTKRWTEEMVQSTFMPMTYNAFGPGWNEQIQKGWGVPISPEYMHPIREKSYGYTRYPIPRIARAFQSMSLRQVYYEMVRATLEGYRNQLWLFLLGSADKPPSPKEVTAFNSMLSGMSGERTGLAVWRAPVESKILVPASITDAISPEVEQAFSLRVFRDLGTSIRVATGNTLPGRNMSEGGLEIDLSLWLSRLNYARLLVMEWEMGFRRRWAEKQGVAAIKAMRTTTVRFSKPMIEVAAIIDKELKPLYSMGPLSVETTLTKAGYNYEGERKRKKGEQKEKELWQPPSTFAQSVVNQGAPSKQVESERSPGRPPNGEVKAMTVNQIQAATEDEEHRKKYFALILALIGGTLLQERDADEFIASLKALNDEWLEKIYLSVYERTGGMGQPSQAEIRYAAEFVNSYADNFLQDLKDAVESGADLRTFVWRALLYPDSGYKMAAQNAQMKAMSEKGARSWRRILHPELSESGPCPECTADAQVIHPVEEPFVLLHPNDVCGLQWLSVQYFTGGGMPSVEVPLPETPNEVTEFLKSLGQNVGTPKVRRNRNA